MQSIQISILAVLGGFALYPFLINQSRNQRKNACFVLGSILLTTTTLSPTLHVHGPDSNVIGGGLFLLSYVFYSAALLNIEFPEGTIQNRALLVFCTGILATICIVFTNALAPALVFSLIQLTCMLYFTANQRRINPWQGLRNMVFSILYVAAAIASHVGFYVDSSSFTATHIVDLVIVSLLALTALNLIVHDFMQAAIKSKLRAGAKIDSEALKLTYRSKRIMKDFQHDLRQPLSTVGILASVGKAISKDPEVTARYQHIQTSQRALKGLMESFFDQLSYTLRYPAESDNLPLAKVRLDEIINPLVEEYRFLAGHKNLQIRYVPTDAVVFSNKNALAKIIRNGLDNALKYTNAGGIVVGTRRKAGGVCLQIADTGSGVENDLVAKHNKGWGHGSQIIQELSEQILATTDCKNRYYANRLAGSKFEVFIPHEKTTVNEQQHTERKANRLSVRIFCDNEREVEEIKRHLPTECFDDIQYATQKGARWEYIRSIRHGIPSVYIRLAKTLEAKQEATREMKELSALFDRRSCCIVAYESALKKNPQIEFTDDFICVPMNTQIQSNGLAAIKELFPVRQTEQESPQQGFIKSAGRPASNPPNRPRSTLP